VVKVGDEITVKVIGVDNMGRVNLSRKAVFGESSTPSQSPQTPPRNSPQGRPQDHRRGGPGDRRRN